jgi:hypothetical protein
MEAPAVSAKTGKAEANPRTKAWWQACYLFVVGSIAVRWRRMALAEEDSEGGEEDGRRRSW